MKKEPLYLQVANQITNRFIDGQSIGVRLPTQNELQELFQVSSMTVRNALSYLAQRGAVQIRQGSGAFVARPVKTSKHTAILMAGDISNSSLSPYYPKLLQEVRHALYRKSISCRSYLGFHDLQTREEFLILHELMEDLRLERIHSVVTLLGRKHPSWMSEIRRRSIPFLGAPAGYLPGVSNTTDYVVSTDRAKKARKLMDYLLHNKRKKLCIISSKMNSLSEGNISRYIQLLAPEYGVSAESFLPSSSEVPTQWKEFQNQLNNPEIRPDAILVIEDTFFPRVQTIIEQLPYDWADVMEIILVGSDAVNPDIRIPLSRMTFSVKEQSELLAESLHTILNGGEVPSFIEVPTNLDIKTMRSNR